MIIFLFTREAILFLLHRISLMLQDSTSMPFSVGQIVTAFHFLFSHSTFPALTCVVLLSTSTPPAYDTLRSHRFHLGGGGEKGISNFCKYLCFIFFPLALLLHINFTRIFPFTSVGNCNMFFSRNYPPFAILSP